MHHGSLLWGILVMTLISCVPRLARAEKGNYDPAYPPSLSSASHQGVNPVPQPVTAQAPIPVAPNTESNWYGWQTLSLDAVAVSAASLGVATQSGSILAFSGVPYVLGAPFIHARHARWGAAAGSLGLRIGLPVLLGVLPGASDDTHSCSSAEADTCGVGPHAAGFGVGVIAAMAIDAAVLAREELPASAPGANDYRARVSYSPMIGIDAKQLKLGLAGTF